MAKDLPQLVNNIADDHPLKAFLSNQMNGVIQSKNYGKVLELFDLVTEAGTQLMQQERTLTVMHQMEIVIF